MTTLITPFSGDASTTREERLHQLLAPIPQDCPAHFVIWRLELTAAAYPFMTEEEKLKVDDWYRRCPPWD